MSPSPTHRLERHWATAGFALLALGFFHPLLLGHWLAGGDILNAYLPWKEFWRQSVWQGDWPLWNPMTFAGMPFQANVQVGQFYPPNWLFLALPAGLGFTLLTVAHYGFGAWGLWRFAGRLSDCPVARFVACAVFFATAFFTTRFVPGVVLFLFAAAWAPWILDAMLDLTDRPTPSRALRPAIFLSLQLLAGAPQISFYTLIMVAAWLPVGLHARNKSGKAAGALCIRRDRIPQRYTIRAALVFALALGLFALLAAVQVLPTRDYIAASFGRSGGAQYEYVIDGSLSLAMSVAHFIPFIFGDPTEPLHYWGGLEGYHELNAYVGWMALALGVVGFLAGGAWATRRDLREPRPWRRALVCYCRFLIVFSAVLSFGGASPVFRWFYLHVPGFDMFRDPARIQILGLFGWSLLAAVGADMLLNASAQTDRVRQAMGKAVWTFAIVAVAAMAGSLLATRALVTLLGLGAHHPEFIHGIPNPAFADMVQGARIQALIALGWALGAAAILLILTTLSARPLARRSAGALVVAWLVADLLWFGVRFVETAPPATFRDTFYAQSPVVQLLQERTADGSRLLYDDTIISFYWDQNQPEILYGRTMMLAVPQARGYNPVIPRPYVEFANHWRPGGEDPFTDDPGAMLSVDIQRNRKLYGMWNIATTMSYLPLDEPTDDLDLIARFPFPRPDEGYVVPPDLPTELRVYGVKNALGKAWLADPIDAADLPAADVFERMLSDDFDPATQALVHEPLEISTPLPSGADDAGTVRIVSETSDRTVFSVSGAPAGRLLVAPIAWFPGWRARIDGRPTPLLRVNHAMMGVQLPGGDVEVELRFLPRSFLLGLAISALAWLAVLGAVGVVWRRGRKRRLDGGGGMEEATA